MKQPRVPSLSQTGTPPPKVPNDPKDNCCDIFGRTLSPGHRMLFARKSRLNRLVALSIGSPLTSLTASTG